MSSPTQRQSVVSIALVLTFLLAGLTGAATTPAIAQEDEDEESFIDAVLSDDNESAIDLGIASISTEDIDLASAYIRGAANRAWLATSNVRRSPINRESDSVRVTNHADAVQSYFNYRNESFVEAANEWGIGADSRDVFELTFRIDGAEETRYLVADYNESSAEYTSARIVEETDRTVDECVEARDHATTNAKDELESFHTRFVEPMDQPGAPYKRYIAGAYAGKATTSLMGGDC